MKVSHPKVVDVFPTASTAQHLERLTQPDTLPEILQEGIDKVAAQIKRGRLLANDAVGYVLQGDTAKAAPPVIRCS